MLLIDFQVTFVGCSPISGHFRHKLLGRCSSKFAVANTGKKGMFVLFEDRQEIRLKVQLKLSYLEK